MTMGSDFHYENAYEWYKNLEKLMKYVNAKVFSDRCFYEEKIISYISFSKQMAVM